jgi:hypothetical protein
MKNGLRVLTVVALICVSLDAPAFAQLKDEKVDDVSARGKALHLMAAGRPWQ